MPNIPDWFAICGICYLIFGFGMIGFLGWAVNQDAEQLQRGEAKGLGPGWWGGLVIFFFGIAFPLYLILRPSYKVEAGIKTLYLEECAKSIGIFILVTFLIAIIGGFFEGAAWFLTLKQVGGKPL